MAATTQSVLSGNARSSHGAEAAALDRAVEDVAASAARFTALGPAERASLLRQCLPLIREQAPGWVAAACEAKGLPRDHPLEGEDWVTGPFITVRNARLLAQSLEAVARDGRPPFGTGHRVRPDGRVEVKGFPVDAMDAVLWSGYRGHVMLREGIDAETARRRQASLYTSGRRDARVCAILGAGNVSSIPPTDAFHKLFVEGEVCVLKMNPVNEYVGPFLEAALRPLIEPGFLRIVYGGAAEGARLVEHPKVDDVHVTGSAETYDRIVWGPPGPEREARKREGRPLLTKTISAELGNVSPVIVAPARYSSKELDFLARAVAAMVANNASFNCNAGKLLVLSEAWPQREDFAAAVSRTLAEIPPRRAYYPGAFERYEGLLSGRLVQRFGQPGDDELAWAYVRGLDSREAEEELFGVEPFCAVLSETTLAESDPVRFLEAAVEFCNGRTWGTLNAMICAHPSLEKDAGFAAALDRAVLDLRYGTVGVNVWPALGYAVACLPWGGHPSARPEDIQSGLGWVHNTFMLEGVDKTVVRGPLTPMLKPAWHADHRSVHRLGPKLVDFEAAPSWLKVPGLAAIAMRG